MCKDWRLQRRTVSFPSPTWRSGVRVPAAGWARLKFPVVDVSCSALPTWYNTTCTQHRECGNTGYSFFNSDSISHARVNNRNLFKMSSIVRACWRWITHLLFPNLITPLWCLPLRVAPTDVAPRGRIQTTGALFQDLQGRAFMNLTDEHRVGLKTLFFNPVLLYNHPQDMSTQQAEVRGHSRVSIQGKIVVEFDYSGMVQLLVYPVLPACMPGRK